VRATATRAPKVKAAHKPIAVAASAKASPPKPAATTAAAAADLDWETF